MYLTSKELSVTFSNVSYIHQTLIRSLTIFHPIQPLKVTARVSASQRSIVDFWQQRAPLARQRYLLLLGWFFLASILFCSVVSSAPRTLCPGRRLPKSRRFTESSYVRRATMFWRRKPWQYSSSCVALYTCGFE